MPRSKNFRLPQPFFSEPTFNEGGVPTPDPSTFRTPHSKKKDDELYTELGKLIYEDVVSFPKSSAKDGDLFSYSSALGFQGKSDTEYIERSGKIVFHLAGDTGASVLSKLPDEESVADHLSDDFSSSPPPDRPAFLYHVGDVIYNFGEWQYYYDQFYEPFRNYPAPIFAIPGNHDAFVIPGTPPANPPLKTFMRNFCSKSVVVTREAGSLHRTAMTEPGVYFALDAPFVRIIGLFSNALEDPGLISSQSDQKTKWPGVPDYQLSFLTQQLKKIKSQKYQGAVLIALHHPPLAYQTEDGKGGDHLSNPMMLRQIDAICKAQGVYPHAIITGHIHNYQRFTRNITFTGEKYEVPFIISGNGGHNLVPIVKHERSAPNSIPEPGSRVDYIDSNPAVEATGLTFEQYDDKHYGYLRITVNSSKLHVEYHATAGAAPLPSVDMVDVDLDSHTII